MYIDWDGTDENFSSWETFELQVTGIMVDVSQVKVKFRPIHAKTGELRTELCDLRPATCVLVHRDERQFYWQFVPDDRIYRIYRLSLSLSCLLFSFRVFHVVHGNLYFSISTVQLPFGAILLASVLRILRALLLHTAHDCLLWGTHARIHSKLRSSIIKEKIYNSRRPQEKSIWNAFSIFPFV